MNDDQNENESSENPESDEGSQSDPVLDNYEESKDKTGPKNSLKRGAKFRKIAPLEKIVKWNI